MRVSCGVLLTRLKIGVETPKVGEEPASIPQTGSQTGARTPDITQPDPGNSVRRVVETPQTCREESVNTPGSKSAIPT